MHKNTSQAKTNEQNKNKQALNNKGNNFWCKQKLLRGWKSFVYVWVLFLRSNSFRKKNKQTWNCPDNLIHNTTHVQISIPKPNQMMMSSVAKVKFILQPRSILAMYDRHLKPSFIKFKSRSQKILIFKFQYQNEKKRKNGKNFFWVTKRGIYGITNRGKF